MSAGLKENDHMFSVRKTPWHGLGTVLEKAPKDIDDALHKSGLDWDVVQTPVFIPNPGKNEDVKDPYVQVVDRAGKAIAYANVRSDDGSVLGTVSDRYRILQNKEAFSFLANLIGTDMMFETAGSLHGGKRVWVLTKLPEYIDVGGDATEIFAFITNDHTGGRAVKAAVSPVRIVCQNTLTWALNDAPRIYAFPHIGDPSHRLQEARDVLGMTINYAKQFKELGDRLASQKITEKKLREIMQELYPVGTEMTGLVKQNRLDAHEHVVWLFKEGATVGNAPGTKWSAANAICEFIDYGKSTDSDRSRLTRAMDDPSKKKHRVLDLVMSA